MILLRINISEESGTIQIQKLSHGDGSVTVHERAMLERLLAASTRELGEYAKIIGAGPVVNNRHRELEPHLAARGPSMSNVYVGGNAA